ncbi:MAG: high-potential iron-sulfur protein [Candidatus Eremiobacteraeota bacterium]|nr:high-potential iron-sulfur protein [Candidatus Eremiobacteraeota bacterium]
MNDFKQTFSRRLVLKALAAIPVALMGAFSGRLVADAAKGSKAQYRYQDLPKHGQRCAACRFFIKGKSPLSRGACTLVAGSISPIGWCIAFAKKR